MAQLLRSVLENIPTDLTRLGQVALAMVLGAFVGWEREQASKPAGMRTHMLVAGVSALLPLLGRIVTEHYQTELGQGLVQADPLRLFVAVVTGISFLGAGTIIHRASGRAEGLTTAASLLMATAIGMAVALSAWMLAVGATVLTLVTLRGVSALERRQPGRTQS